LVSDIEVVTAACVSLIVAELGIGVGIAVGNAVVCDSDVGCVGVETGVCNSDVDDVATRVGGAGVGAGVGTISTQRYTPDVPHVAAAIAFVHPPAAVDPTMPTVPEAGGPDGCEPGGGGH